MTSTERIRWSFGRGTTRAKSAATTQPSSAGDAAIRATRRSLRPSKEMVVTDEDGHKHHFLTDPIALARLFASREVRYESIYEYVS